MGLRDLHGPFGIELLAGSFKLQDLLEAIVANLHEQEASMTTLQEKLGLNSSDESLGLYGTMASGRFPNVVAAENLTPEQIQEVNAKGGFTIQQVQQLVHQLERQEADDAKYDALVRQMNDHSTKHDELVAKLGIEHLEIEHHYEELKETERELKQTERELKDTERKRLDTEKDLKETEKHLRETEMELKETERIVQAEHSVLVKLQAQVTQLREALGLVEGKEGNSIVNILGAQQQNSDLESISQRLDSLESKTAQFTDNFTSTIAAAMAPLEGALNALDAKIDSHVKVRIEDQETRITNCDRRVAMLSESPSSVTSEVPQTRGTVDSWAVGDEQREATMKALDETRQSVLEVRHDVHSLSGQLSSVVETVSAMRDGDEHHTSSQSVDQNLNMVREELESRMAQLEQRIANKDFKNDDGKELNDLYDTLAQVESDIRQLESVATKDTRPKLMKQAEEMQRLWQELSGVVTQVKAAKGQNMSATTTTGQSHCLSCYSPRRPQDSRTRIMLGKDGRVYFQGSEKPGLPSIASCPSIAETSANARDLRHPTRASSAGAMERANKYGRYRLSRATGLPSERSVNGVTTPSVAGFYF